MSVTSFRIAPAAFGILRKTRNRVRRLLGDPVLVLMYHRVTTLPSDPHLLAVSPSHFRAQLRLLKDSFPLVRFESDWTRAEKPAVAITFDDGYGDNATEALPILEELAVPATFFVSTGTVNTPRLFWWDELAEIALGDGPFDASFSITDDGRTRTWPTASAGERRAFHRDVHQLMLRSGPERRDRWFSQLRRWRHARQGSSEAHRAMTSEELRRLASSPYVTIGAHTVTHSSLACLTPEAQRDEIVGSKRDLESWTGKPITVFSYPFGTRSDYDRVSRTLCKEAGYWKAAANFPGQAYRWTDPFQIPRNLVRNWPGDEFARQLETFWEP